MGEKNVKLEEEKDEWKQKYTKLEKKYKEDKK